MADLSLYLLGPPRVKLDDDDIEVKPRKALALLIYLAVTAERHTRDALATLLWPESNQRLARRALSNRLSELKQTLGSDCIDATSQTIGLHGGYWLDVAEFQDKLAGEHGSPQLLSEAAALYRDDFLSGFTLPDCPAYDAWQYFQAESLCQVLGAALDRLVGALSARGDYETAVPHARRRLALDPLHEPACRQLMRLYAWSGQQPAALREYERCCQHLAEELGVEPEEGTTTLYEQIKSGTMPKPPIAKAQITPYLPEFLSEAGGEEPGAQALFVARENELAALRSGLEGTLTGLGRVQFVSGEAGAGKTALAAAFFRQAQRDHPDLLLGLGSCNALTGAGDPYLPFRDVLRSLTGDVDDLWLAGTLSRAEAQRQWRTLPESAQALVAHGPDLIGSFLPARQLLARARAAAPEGADWLSELQSLVESSGVDRWDVAQGQFFEQYGRFLQALSARRPLLIILDDLQWVDSASANLLFHLGRHLQGSRILFLGLYRPDEVAAGRQALDDGSVWPHPIQKILNEFRRQFGGRTMNLDRVNETGGRAFLEALVDSEPNRLGAGFRERLLRHTGGQPLFSVEMLRAMQERGDLVRDADGRWAEGPALDWDKLPQRIEGVIEERIQRLEAELKETLSVASVEGEDFTAQVVARVREVAERELLRQLSRELDKKHHLVGEQGIEQLGRQKLYHFRFRHSLFQQHLYNKLGEIEREVLHLQVGETLEALYGERAAEIAPQLALHFSEAGEREKAVRYLLEAGDTARSLYANEEAITHYERALAFLREQDDHEKTARTLMKLGLTYHNAFAYRRARQAYQEGFAFWQRASSTPPREQPGEAPHPLRVDWMDEPTTLDPALADETTTSALIDQLFSGLVELSPQMEIGPHLAQSWDILDSGRRYVFHLRDDVRWSDGAQVTAEDFEYAWKRVLSPAAGSNHASLLYDIKGARAFNLDQLADPDQVGVKALGRFELQVELEQPASYILQLLADTITYPVPRHVVERHGLAWAEPRNIVSNGPFRLECWQPGESIVLVRHSAYFGQSRGNVRRVELSLISDPAARLQMYESGELDVLSDGGLSQLESALRRHAGDFIQSPSLFTRYVAFDVNRTPFDDRRVRRAFVLAINREALVDAAMRHVDRTPAGGGFVPPGMPGHSPQIGLRFDRQRARQLLATAGFPGGKDFPQVRLVAPLFTESVCNYLREGWQKSLGVTIEWATAEAIDFDQLHHSGSYQLYFHGWMADYPDPDSFLRMFWQTSSGRWIGWRNEAYDQLLERVREVMNQEERLALFRRADTILVEEAPIMPLAYGRRRRLIKPWVKLAPITVTGSYAWKDAIIEPH